MVRRKKEDEYTQPILPLDEEDKEKAHITEPHVMGEEVQEETDKTEDAADNTLSVEYPNHNTSKTAHEMGGGEPSKKALEETYELEIKRQQKHGDGNQA